jgi:hypothetical protein
VDKLNKNFRLRESFFNELEKVFIESKKSNFLSLPIAL